jgi:hypothetical protein
MISNREKREQQHMLGVSSECRKLRTAAIRMEKIPLSVILDSSDSQILLDLR